MNTVESNSDSGVYETILTLFRNMDDFSLLDKLAQLQSRLNEISGVRALSKSDAAILSHSINGYPEERVAFLTLVRDYMEPLDFIDLLLCDGHGKATHSFHNIEFQMFSNALTSLSFPAMLVAQSLNSIELRDKLVHCLSYFREYPSCIAQCLVLLMSTVQGKWKTAIYYFYLAKAFSIRPDQEEREGSDAIYAKLRSICQKWFQYGLTNFEGVDIDQILHCIFPTAEAYTASISTLWVQNFVRDTTAYRLPYQLQPRVQGLSEEQKQQSTQSIGTSSSSANSIRRVSPAPPYSRELMGVIAVRHTNQVPASSVPVSPVYVPESDMDEDSDEEEEVPRFEAPVADDATTTTTATSSISSDALCIACTTRRRNIACLPCGHVCLCRECYARLPLDETPIGRAFRCPICRSGITHEIRVFLS